MARVARTTDSLTMAAIPISTVTVLCRIAHHLVCPVY